MKPSLLIALLLIGPLLYGGGPTPTSASVAAAPPAFATIREKFDLWRGPTTLRGANIWQQRVTDDDEMGPGPVGPPYSQQDFKQLAAWGANYVNISHPGVYSEGGDYRFDDAVFQNLQQLIDRAEQADLFVVISFRTGPGRKEEIFDDDDPKPSRVWKSKPAQAAWVEMWRETARRLKDRANVVGYDLMVEPETKKHGVWNRLAQQITAAIREVDARTPILIGAADWSTVDSLDGLELNGDARTVYTVHQYEPYEYSHQESRRAGYEPAEVEALYRRINDFKNENGVPMAVNEFGVERFAKGASDYTAQQMRLIEAMGANHALWLWETSFPLDYDEFNFRRGPDSRNHRDVQTSALIEVIKADWAANAVRPSDVGQRF
ncbi:MAG TPA: cellulase family glycosylhydrolase [Blastocatellia bacterium]|nr:cellulase family glycosylhydrolase [Blastocatellia bacterium]